MPAADELLTERLLLRRWREPDEAAMVEINSDPEVTRYLNRPVDRAATAAFFARVGEHWDTHGYGLWAVESREAVGAGRLLGPGRLLGFAGVAYPGFLPELATRLELGWRLARDAWGRGLATEAARAARDHIFASAGVPELISIIHPENERSRRVASKLGMHLERGVFNPVIDREVEVWQLSAPAAGGSRIA